MNTLKEFDELLSYVKEHPLVKRYQELEEKIHQDKQLLQKYEQLKEYQKQLVNAKASKKPFAEIEKVYLATREELLTHPFMGEYLDVIEMVNSDLQLIQDIIASEINMDLS